MPVVPAPSRATAPSELERPRPRRETLRRAAHIEHHPVSNGRVEDRPARVKSQAAWREAGCRAPPQLWRRRRWTHRTAHDRVNCTARNAVADTLCRAGCSGKRRLGPAPLPHRETGRDRRCDDISPHAANPRSSSAGTVWFSVLRRACVLPSGVLHRSPTRARQLRFGQRCV
jgi:hypothetical protein